MAATPGWYGDPWAVAPWRWWDGRQWTAHLWPMQGTTLPWAGAGPVAVDARSDRFGRAFWPSIGWMLVSMVAGVGIAIPPTVVATIVGGEQAALATFVLAFYPAMFLGFWLASRKLSRRYGSGDMGRDYGWRRFRTADIGWGLLAGLGALVAQIVLGIVLPQPDDGSYRDAVFGESPSTVLLVAMGFAIVVGAPLFEELLFRGPMMRSLIARFGTWPGLVLQGAVFALYHVVGNPALVTLWYLLPLFAVGVIFGFVAHRTGRMATSQIAHASMNVLAFVALLVSL